MHVSIVEAIDRAETIHLADRGDLTSQPTAQCPSTSIEGVDVPPEFFACTY